MALRAAVLFLAVYALLPVQLVWCTEDGRMLRMEPAVNGQCLAGMNEHCCPTADHAAMQADRWDELHVAAALANSHDHCDGCSDELAHRQSDFHLVRTAQGPTRQLTGGCLFSLLAPNPLGSLQLEQQSWRAGESRMLSLATLHTRVTHLLI